MVVLEAMAAGVPVLAAKVGGLPDLIEDGKNGLFVDPLDPASMRDGVAKMLNNPAMAKQLAVTAKKLARERYHPENIARRHPPAARRSIFHRAGLRSALMSL